MGFGFWVLGFGFWVVGFGFWVLGFGLGLMKLQRGLGPIRNCHTSLLMKAPFEALGGVQVKRALGLGPL